MLDIQTPSPAQNPTPVEAPSAPVEQPIAQPAPQPGAEVSSQHQSGSEDDEWDDVAKDLFPGISDQPEEKKPEAEVATPSSEQKPDDSENPDQQVPEVPVAQTDVDQEISNRAAQRQASEQFQSVRNDIREKIFKEIPRELTDKDGDPIRSVEDMMKLVDPNTGQAFTEEAARLYLMEFKRDLDAKINQAEEFATKIAEVNIAIKEEADLIMKKFGAILDKNPEVRKSLWQQYRKTLVMGPEGVIVNAPVSLFDFFSTSLTPYIAVNQYQEEAERAKKGMEEIQRRQEQVDRSDIHGSGKVDTMSDEDKEWQEAHKNYFGK